MERSEEKSGLSNRSASHRDAEPGATQSPVFIRQRQRTQPSAQLPGDRPDTMVDAIASTQKIVAAEQLAPELATGAMAWA